MSESKVSHHRHEPDHGRAQQDQVPYWKRAHRDWRFWVGVILMFAAMGMFVFNRDLAWVPHSQPRQPAMPTAPAQ